MRKAPPPRIKKVTGGWQLVYYDIKGKRHRPKFASKQEAEAERLKIERQLTDGVHSADASKVTYKEVVEDWVKYSLQRTDIDPGTKIYIENRAKVHLIPDLGHHRMSEFEDSRMRIAQDWIDAKARTGNAGKPYAHNYLRDLKCDLNQSLRFAVSKQILVRNPSVEFPLKLPKAPPRKHRAIPLPDLDKLWAATLVRTEFEREYLQRNRQLSFMAGLTVIVRPGENVELDWENANLNTRRVHVHYAVKYKIGRGPTKTGETKSLAISPPYHTLLSAHKQRLTAKHGEAPTGTIQKSRYGKAYSTSQSLTNHWRTLQRKAGLVDGKEKKTRYRFYDLRHTACSLLRAAGLPADRLDDAMGHSPGSVTALKVYRHIEPSYDGLKYEVDAIKAEFELHGDELDDTIVGLGIWLARRWHIPIAPLPSQARLARSSALALPAPKEITIEPDAVTIASPSDQLPRPPTMRELRRLHEAYAKQQDALGVPPRDIARELHVTTETILKYLPLCPGRPPRLGYNERRREIAKLKPRALEMYAAEATPQQVAEELGVTLATATLWQRHGGRDRDATAQRRARMRAMFAQNMTNVQIGAVLGVSHVAVWHYRRKLGVKPYQRPDDPRKAKFAAALRESGEIGQAAQEAGVIARTAAKWAAEIRAQTQVAGESGTQPAQTPSDDAPDR